MDERERLAERLADLGEELRPEYPDVANVVCVLAASVMLGTESIMMAFVYEYGKEMYDGASRKLAVIEAERILHGHQSTDTEED